MKHRGASLVIAIVILLAAGAGAFIFSRSGHDRARSAANGGMLYTCGMHPQVIRNKPGNCPICGMKLTPIRKQAGGGSTNSASSNEAADVSTITIDPVTVQNMGIRTGVVTQGPLRRTIRTVGAVDFDETALADVTTKFKGWIEKLYVDATGKQVHKGDPLFEIYSPELYSAQTEYLLGLDQKGKASAGSDNLKASALTKLKFFDISEEQIAELAKGGEAKRALQVVAPRDGIVVEKMVVEGQMVDAGMKLYRLADLGLVWVQSQIYEQDLAFLKLGQESVVRLSYLPDREFRGRVTYIYPTLDEKTRTAKVRMEFHNPGFFLKPGMFATVEVHAELEPEALLVPDSAVLRSGEKNTVFVALEGGKFEPRTVTLGPRSANDCYQVLSGLSAGERVVTSGQFMLDSESQLREAIQKMVSPGTGASSNALGSDQSPRIVPQPPHSPEIAQLEVGPTAYICPMPEHVAITYDHPGKCPICGMSLVPVTAAALARLQPGGRVLHYTCPMPEHSDVKLDKPGKCPKCAMTLIPVMQAPLPIESKPSPSATKALYTCPMPEHSDVVSDQPGKCPKCEMVLVPTSSVKHGKVAEENWAKRKVDPSPPLNPESSKHQR